MVCGDFFDNNDATVICRQLGFYGVEEIVDVSVFGGGGRVLVDDLSCTGTESALADCGSINWGFHNCLTPDDVGLICSKWQPTYCTRRNFRGVLYFADFVGKFDP